MIKLRPGQEKVVDFRKGYMAVPAVPGAGKTTVLAYLTAELIEKGFSTKGKILIVTYMNSAVSNFRKKISDFLKDRNLPGNRGYEVRTLHSLALNILKEKPENLLINEDFTIIDSANKGRLLRDAIEEWIRDNRKDFLKYIDYDSSNSGYNKALERWKEEDFPRFINSIISHFKILGLDRKKIKSIWSKDYQNSYLNWAFNIFIKYDKLLDSQGLIDFDDLIVQAYNLLEKDQKLCARLRNKYSYIFEDEAQDSNRLLEKILLQLAGENGNLIRVGDSNQAIMGTFTSADPEIFRRFTERKDVETSSILYSSRSTEQILGLANYLVKWSVNEHPQKECRQALEEKYIYPVPDDDLSPNPETDGYTIAARTFSTSKKEITAISRLAAEHVRENPDKTTAILVPANYIMESLSEKLDQYQVEYKLIKRDKDKYLKIINDFTDLLNYLAEPHKRNKFMKIFNNVILNYLYNEKEQQEDETNFMEKVFTAYDLRELIYPVEGDKCCEKKCLNKLIKDKNLSVLNDLVKKLRLWIEASVSLPPDELILFLAEELKLNTEEMAVAQNMALQIGQKLSNNPHWKLYEIAAEIPLMEETWKNFARKLDERKGFEPEPGVITLTTVHKAKGLEWDTVYLTFLSDDYYPSTLDSRFRAEHYYLKDEFSNPLALARASLNNLLNSETMETPQKEANIETISEKLRLLYVGITRAKINLLLSTHREIIYDNGNSKKVNQCHPFIALKSFIEKERDKYVK